jgi:very-short-patch-repair endonuclease
VPQSPAKPRRLRNGPFLASTAIGQELITRQQLRSSAWRRLFRDVYVSSAIPATYRLRILGAALILPPDAVVTGRTAAHLWGVERCDPDDPIEVLCQRQFGPVNGFSIRVGPLASDERTTRAGVPITTAIHTTWELARTLPLLDAVAWIDGLTHNRVISRKALITHQERHSDEYGHRRAHSTLALCDPRAESPPESRLRVHIVQAGLPVPTPQFQVLVDGEFLARVDLAWPEVKFAVEYDGQWHVDPAQLAEDRARLRALNRAGWHIYHVTRDDMRDVEALLAELSAALTARSTQERR